MTTVEWREPCNRLVGGFVVRIPWVAPCLNLGLKFWSIQQAAIDWMQTGLTYQQSQGLFAAWSRLKRPSKSLGLSPSCRSSRPRSTSSYTIRPTSSLVLMLHAFRMAT